MIVDSTRLWQGVLGQVFLEKTRQGEKAGAVLGPYRAKLHPASRVCGDHGVRLGSEKRIAFFPRQGGGELGGGEMITARATATEIRLLRLHESCS